MAKGADGRVEGEGWASGGRRGRDGGEREVGELSRDDRGLRNRERLEEKLDAPWSDK